MTDSAAAGSATGVKTYNNAISYDNYGKPLQTITEVAKAYGKSTGVVTSVQFSHATPGAFATQNLTRKDLLGIAHTMLNNGDVDLIMGTGHPDHDGNGTDLNKLTAEQCAANWACSNRYDTISQADWTALKAQSQTVSPDKPTWTLLENKADFELLANNNLRVRGPLIGIPKVRWTLQQGREAAVVGKDPSSRAV